MEQALKSFFASRLRSQRKAAGLSQAELGERIGRTAEAVSNIERCKSLPAIDTLIALADALGVPVQSFLPTSEASTPGRRRLDQESEAAALISQLSDKQLDIAVVQLRALQGL